LAKGRSLIKEEYWFDQEITVWLKSIKVLPRGESLAKKRY